MEKKCESPGICHLWRGRSPGICHIGAQGRQPCAYCVPVPLTRSLTWRLLPWLIPIALIFVGLIVVAASLSDADKPTDVDGDAFPTNVRALVTDNALPWAVSQVGVGVTTEINEVAMVDVAATGSSTYSARSVVIRFDSLTIAAPLPGATAATLAEADSSTVATCVVWDVDVSAGVVVARSAFEVERRTGRHDDSDTDALAELCRSAA